jgi:NAD(P)H-dependent flavin oxidoreductase YrpB (nitropropane dioxygenase family)
MLQVGSTEEARRAADANVHIIIAQGVEAGGHVRGKVGLLPLLSSIVESIPDTPVVAAGGIVDGRGLAAALAAGADAVSVGARFVATDESEAHPDYKKRLTMADEADTVHTELFAIGWLPHSPVRVLRNALTDGGEAPGDSIGRMRRGDAMVDIQPFSVTMPTVHVEGRTELMANYAGQGVGRIRDILPAAAVVERMVREAEELISGRLRNIVT